MHCEPAAISNLSLAAVDMAGHLKTVWYFVEIVLGFSVIIFVHELGHFLAAKWAGVRVEQFAIGFFREVFGFTRGETRYSFNLLPLGGYVKMLGQEDFEIDTTGELQVKDDPRSFANKPVGRRMIIVSAGVVMNLLFAGLLFMIVFLIGMNVPSPRIGSVLPDSPAALAGLEPGDVVRDINGEKINEFNEITMAVVLAKPGQTLDFEVQRNGKVVHVPVTPERDPKADRLQAGIGSAMSPVLLVVGPEYKLKNWHDPRPGDRIVEVDGTKVTDANANTVLTHLLSDPLDAKNVVVERPVDPTKEDSPTERVKIDIKPRLLLRRGDISDNPPNLLGLVPFLRVNSVDPDGRADLAGLEPGDIILEWDGIRNPDIRQIDKDVRASATRDPSYPEQDIPIRIRRPRTGQDMWITLRPKVRVTPLIGTRSAPDIQASLRRYGFEVYAEDWLHVASIVSEYSGEPTPAAQSGLPAGAQITKVGDQPVNTWLELAQQFREHVGQTVALGYKLDNAAEQTVEFHVPQSIRAALGVGPQAQIVSIGGKETVDVEVKKDGDRMKVPVSHPLGLHAALDEAVGKTVEVAYRPDLRAALETRSLTITPEMTYPWVGLMVYSIDLEPAAETVVLRKANPLAAIKVGVKKTYYFVLQVYQVMQRMIFSRSVGVENISGPLGIVEMGRRTAEAGPVQLLFFLAIISANLAVINFLPLPIVDGGLMVFLIIEKIKGSPVSVGVQAATQVVGLILLISAFLFVTLQDIARF